LLLFIFHYTTVATFEVSTLPVVKLARQFGPYLQNIKEQKEGEKKRREITKCVICTIVLPQHSFGLF